MFLCYAYIKSPVGETLHHEIHRTACRHGRCDADDSLICLCKFYKRLAKDILKTRWHSFRVFFDNLSCLWIELSRGMPDRCLLFGWFITLALDCANMQHLRTFQVFDLAQEMNKTHNIMTIYWSEISDIKSLEDILTAGEQRLERVVEPNHSTAHAIFHQIIAPQRCIGFVS